MKEKGGKRNTNADAMKHHLIRNYDSMPPFFMTLASPTNHWLFVSSTGGLSAGRVCPENCLFPYETVDKLTEAWRHTGPKTLIFVQGGSGKSTAGRTLWCPFDLDQPKCSGIERNLRKSVLGDKLAFEEINRRLGLAFSYSWEFSDKFGIVRRSRIENIGRRKARLNLLDGILNITPANTSRKLQTESSCLLDAYKRAELLDFARLAVFHYNSLPSDKPEAVESLKASLVWSAGLHSAKVLLSSVQIAKFASTGRVEEEKECRGVKGAYMLCSELSLDPGASREWTIVADVDKDIRDIREVAEIAKQKGFLRDSLEKNICAGRAELERIVASSDGFQLTADSATSTHHLSNVLFNCMRGGVFANGGMIDLADFAEYVATHNKGSAAEAGRIAGRHAGRMISIRDFMEAASASGDRNLRRLAAEYLPLTFSRRHGDPSRPWNQFAIRVKTPGGARLLSYQGNWRDLFQNWESLCLSYPEFTESVIAKFLNCSNAEGYNPYRISREGFEWEKLEHGNPWANIGYWGDHQIIYLLRLLELSRKLHPGKLRSMLSDRSFAHANIPYRIKSYKEILLNPRQSIAFDDGLDAKLRDAAIRTGNDANLLPGPDGEPLHVSMMEKLLASMLAKLANLVPGGGIWMNTQRPEWNDANNALAGYGLSVVTTCHLHRFMGFLDTLVSESGEDGFEVSCEIAELMGKIKSVLERNIGITEKKRTGDSSRRKLMDALGAASCEFRRKLYGDGLSGRLGKVSAAEVRNLLRTAMRWTAHCIVANERGDGLYHSYNILVLKRASEASVKNLPEMLEGQAAVLSSGLLSPEKALRLLESLRESQLYRPDQNSYMLQPDRALKSFVEKNEIPPKAVRKSTLLRAVLDDPENRLACRDISGGVHFDSGIKNEEDLDAVLKGLAPHPKYSRLAKRESGLLREIFEETFRHSEFTGRAGSFFAYEGLGCVYWHMVSKLLLAVQEIYFKAAEDGRPEKITGALLDAYYEIRGGLGFNKTPEEYGAFPTDPYSHTPKHAGASQPGMTGQVKEEIITRLGELGVSFSDGRISFRPKMLRREEFLKEEREFAFPSQDGADQIIRLEKDSLAFTLCGVPVVYQLSDEDAVTLFRGDGKSRTFSGTALDVESSSSIFERKGEIAKIAVRLRENRI